MGLKIKRFREYTLEDCFNDYADGIITIIQDGKISYQTNCEEL
jgi:hypothetical protein